MDSSVPNSVVPNVSEVYGKLSQKLDYLIDIISTSRCIPSVLDKEELVQECNILLWNMVNNSRYVDENHVEACFRKLVRKHVSNMLRHHKTQGRDYRKVISASQSNDSDESFDVWDVMAPYGTPNAVYQKSVEGCAESEDFGQPDQKVAQAEILSNVRNDLVKYPDAQKLFELFVDPTPLFELAENYKAENPKSRNCKNEIPLMIYRQFLGLGKSHFLEMYKIVKYVMYKWFPKDCPSPEEWRFNYGNSDSREFLQSHGIEVEAV